MRIGVLSDPHLGMRVGRTKAARLEFMDFAFKHFQTIMQDMVDAGVQAILIAGDIFDTSKPSVRTVKSYAQIISSILEQHTQIMVIPGNHDRSRLPSTLLDYFQPNYHSFNTYMQREVDGIRIIGFPYSKHPQPLLRRAITGHQRTIIFCHQLFYGSWFGPQHYIFRNEPDVLPTDIPENIIVFSGHVHRAQVVDQRVLFCGSIIRTSFEEAIEPKGYMIADIDDDKMTVKFHPLKNFPMLVVELTPKQALEVNLEKVPSPARILLRLVGRKVDTAMLGLIYRRFPSSSYPYLTISPRKDGSILSPLYFTDQPQFTLHESAINLPFVERLQDSLIVPESV